MPDADRDDCGQLPDLLGELELQWRQRLALHAAGAAACTNSGSTCQLAAGTYDFVLLEYPEYVSDFGVVFIAANETRGCTATGDTDFASGPATGTFTGLGEEVCLTLPTASGLLGLRVQPGSAAGASEAAVQILDSTGASTCSSPTDTSPVR